MPLEDHFTDDYIASLLAKDAKTSNAKYTSYGLQELLPKRPTFNAPKPNTRFLKNIIRETDSHNAALRAKTVADSRSRSRRIYERSRTLSPRKGDGRLSREDGHRPKRRRMERNDRMGSHKPRSYGDRDDRFRTHRSHQRHRDDRHGDAAEVDRQSRRHHRHHRQRSHHPCSRSRSPSRHRRSRDRRKSSSLASGSRSRSPCSEKQPYGRGSHHRSTPKSHESLEEDAQLERSHKFNGCDEDTEFIQSMRKKDAPSPASDSDPLEAIIGPPPPPPQPKVKARGRGTFASTSAMDSHFSSNYDPTIDVQPDPDIDDDWDMALEALRDRQKWQKQGAERLKAAGFTEEEVQKWEKGGEKTEEDVRWRGRGEGREWDRGKVVGEDGVDTKPEWGRLSGT